MAAKGDEAALADAILRLAGDARLREEIGQSGRDRAGRLFSEERMHAEYEAVYQEMLG